jgi:hypothetical protein
MTTPTKPDPLEQIKKLYYNATKSTIQKDITRAIALLKAIPDEDTRQDAAVYMDGLAEMRKEWAEGQRRR